jgi:hypothetical protein
MFYQQPIAVQIPADNLVGEGAEASAPVMAPLDVAQLPEDPFGPPPPGFLEENGQLIAELLAYIPEDFDEPSTVVAQAMPSNGIVAPESQAHVPGNPLFGMAEAPAYQVQPAVNDQWNGAAYPFGMGEHLFHEAGPQVAHPIHAYVPVLVVFESQEPNGIHEPNLAPLFGAPGMNAQLAAPGNAWPMIGIDLGAGLPGQLDQMAQYLLMQLQAAEAMGMPATGAMMIDGQLFWIPVAEGGNGECFKLILGGIFHKGTIAIMEHPLPPTTREESWWAPLKRTYWSMLARSNLR